MYLRLRTPPTRRLSDSHRMQKYLRLLRPHHYAKNLAVFMPLFFAVRITELDLVLRNLVAFVLFSVLASAVYIFNDIRDLGEDREHPLKRHRPLAAGEIDLKSAVTVHIVLVVVSLLCAFLFQQHLFFILLSYFFLNVAYSLLLKHVPLIDICVISITFVLRIGAGAVVSGVELRMWMILITFLLAMFLGMAKRREDVVLAAGGGTVRKAVDGYNVEFVNAAMVLMASVIIVSYISYTISPEVMSRFKSEHLYVSVVFVILGILRFLQLTFVGNERSDPTYILLTDRFLQLIIAAWLATFLVLIY